MTRASDEQRREPANDHRVSSAVLEPWLADLARDVQREQAKAVAETEDDQAPKIGRPMAVAEMANASMKLNASRPARSIHQIAPAMRA